MTITATIHGDGAERGTAAAPRSESSIWTGVSGLAAACLAIAAIGDWLQPGWLKTLGVLGATAGAMILVDAIVYRTTDNPSTGLAREALRPLDARRLALKLAGFWSTLAGVGSAYAILTDYSGPFFAPFKDVAFWSLPGLAVASPFYFAYVDRRQRNPDDAYAQLGLLLTGRKPDDWTGLRQHCLGWLVKAFFLPLMFMYAHNGLLALWARDGIPSPADFSAFFAFSIELLYLFDVLLAVVAYTLTLRLFDTHIRSVDPTLAGWAVCLVCYPPFVNGTLGAYFAYDGDGITWDAAFAPYPVLHIAWGTSILALIGIYTLATVAFGLRFSNLTNRGIITTGPYRWVKHPAYLSKNISWWLISIPFVTGAGWIAAFQSCVLLAGINLVYFLRARTEERHLRADSAYRDYEAFIAEHGLWAVIRRSVRMSRREHPA